jgi:hypothetical protein
MPAESSSATCVCWAKWTCRRCQGWSSAAVCASSSSLPQALALCMLPWRRQTQTTRTCAAWTHRHSATTWTQVHSAWVQHRSSPHTRHSWSQASPPSHSSPTTGSPFSTCVCVCVCVYVHHSTRSLTHALHKGNACGGGRGVSGGEACGAGRGTERARPHGPAAARRRSILWYVKHTHTHTCICICIYIYMHLHLAHYTHMHLPTLSHSLSHACCVRVEEASRAKRRGDAPPHHPRRMPLPQPKYVHSYTLVQYILVFFLSLPEF